MVEPFLYETVDMLYNAVMDKMPQVIQDRDMSCAFALGSLGIYGVVKGLQLASKHVMDRIIPNFDESWLPFLEKVCVVGMMSAPVLYAGIDPEGAKEIVTNHPTYTSGMAGVYIGSLAGAFQDLHKRSLEKKLED